jgi:hypothetical protein
MLRQRRLGFDGGEIEPTDFTLFEQVQPNPVDDARLVDTDFKRGYGRRTVHKVNSANISRSQQVKASNSITWNAIKIVFASFQRKAYHFNELLLTARQVFAQAEQSHAMFAERIHSDCDGSAIGPKRLVALELDRALISVT